MSSRKHCSIGIPKSIEFDFDQVSEKIQDTLKKVRIYNKNNSANTQYPSTVAELYILAMDEACEKILKKIGNKVTEDELEKVDSRRKYLREYYREYRETKK